MKTDAEIKVLINDHFKAIDGREAGLNNDTLNALLAFWKNNLGSELVIRKDTTHTTNQDPQIVIGFNVTKSGDSFSVSTPAKSWTNYQWANAGGYYHIIYEYTDQTPPTFICNAAYDNVGTYYDNVYTTIAKALAAERNLFGRMADAIRYVNGSSSTINGQDIPNEIRALKEISPVVKTYDNLTDYLTDIGQILYPNAERPPKPIPVVGPDGESYNFVINPTISAGGGEYKFYSRHPFCISKEITNSTGYSLLTAGKADDTSSGADTLYTINTRQGTYGTSLSNVTSGASADGAVSGEWYQTGLSSWTTFPYNWSVWLTEAEATAANVPIFDTNDEALEYCLKSPVINAQDFPQAILALDNKYLAPNGQKYYYKYTYYGIYSYQGFTADFDVYTNIKIGCLSTDRKAYALYNGTMVKVAVNSAPAGTYTNGDSGSASNDYVHYNQSGYTSYYIEQCYYSRSGQNGIQLIVVKDPSEPNYPGSFNSTFPIFSTEQALLEYLNS